MLAQPHCLHLLDLDGPAEPEYQQKQPDLPSLDE